MSQPSAPPRPVSVRERRLALRGAFLELLGYDPAVPAGDRRAVGDPEILRQTVTNVVAWINEHGTGAASPLIPHQQVRSTTDPRKTEWRAAAGTDQINALIADAVTGGLTTSAVKAEWDAAYRRAVARAENRQR